LDTLWAALDKKYAKEIKAKKAKQASEEKAKQAAAKHAENVQRLTVFYEANNPEKVGIVEKTLAQYKGKEEKLWAALKKKYKDATI